MIFADLNPVEDLNSSQACLTQLKFFNKVIMYM